MYDRLDREQPRPWDNYPWNVFGRQPRDVQDRRVLEAVGVHHGTVTQIHDAMRAENADCFIGGDDLRRLLDRLVAAGELGREPWREGPCRYRWFRRVPDAIVDFEHAFKFQEEAV